MKERLFLFAIAFAMLGAACTAPQEEETSFDFNNTCWFDGYEFFVGSVDTTSGLCTFAGGTLHEGGSTFALRRVAEDTFVIQPAVGADWVAVGVEGDTVVHERCGESSILVCHRPDDPECDTLYQYDPGDRTPKEAYEELLVQKRLRSIAGRYFDARKKATYQFVDTFLVRTDAREVADTQSFRIFYAYDMPSHVLLLSGGESLWYELTDSGMDVYEAKYLKSVEDYERGGRIAQLEKQQ